MKESKYPVSLIDDSELNRSLYNGWRFLQGETIHIDIIIFRHIHRLATRIPIIKFTPCIRTCIENNIIKVNESFFQQFVLLI